MKTKQFVASVDKPTTSCGQITIDAAMSKGKKYPRSSETVAAAAADGFGNPLPGERHDAHLFSRQTRMLERFDPKYALPTHKYFSKVAIPSLYARTRETVTSELSET